MIKGRYIPFGSQYYRAPSPHPEDWERDLKNMAGLGFNMVKFWVQWRWNHPEKDRFYFDDIDRLMDLAQQFKLKVMLNTIFDVAPAWIYEKYPDASMVTLNERKIGPQTQPHRQIGGLGYCFNHDGIMNHFFHFLRETVKRYRNHPALEIWNVGSEPELTSSMAEMRLYADDAVRMGDMLCYCENCFNKFVIWLRKKYGKIENLNRAWNRNYTGFEEVEIPITRNTFNDMIDWRMFFVYTLGENVKRRFEVTRDEDKGSHSLMCHHVFIQGFPITSTANDPWNVGQYGDLHGFTQMDDAMMIDVLRSCAKDKPVISAEMLMLPGYTLDLPNSIDANDIKRFIFSGIAGNLKGFIFWQYRPEILGREAPTWGLTWLDGSPTPWLKSVADVGDVLQKNASFLLDAAPQTAEVALLYHPQNQIFAWISTKNEKNATDSLLGYHRALYEHNFRIDFVHPSEFEMNILKNYKVLVIPFPYWLGEKICSKLDQWVEAGGVLIGEAYFAGWNVEQGHHEKIVPGYGLHEVFQTRQGLVEPVIGENTEIELLENLPYLHKGSVVKGSLVRESFFIEGARVLACHSNGQPAVTCAEYGKGKAILIGSYIGLPFHRQKCNQNANLIAGLVEYAMPISRPRVEGNAKVRIDILTGLKNQTMIIVQNLENRSAEITAHLPFKINNKLKEQFSSEILSSIELSAGKGSKISMQLTAKEVKVYCD